MKTTKVSPTAMLRSPDITTDPEWIGEQIDRLSGFEMLHAVVTGNQLPIPPATLADKLGVYKGYPYSIVSNIRKTLPNGK